MVDSGAYKSHKSFINPKCTLSEVEQSYRVPLVMYGFTDINFSKHAQWTGIFVTLVLAVDTCWNIYLEI